MSTPINYTCTNLAEHLEGMSHDVVSDFLKRERLTARHLWELVAEQIDDSAGEIYEQKINTLLQQVYNQPDSQAETGHDDSPHVDKVKESQI